MKNHATTREESAKLHHNGWPKRYTLVALCFVASFICYLDRVNISVAAIAMQNSFGWSETTKGIVMSSFLVGYMIFQIPSGYLVGRFGGRIVLAVAVVWWSLATALTPAAAGMSFAALIACRIAMGLGEAAMFPAAYGMFARWIPRTERSRSISILLSGIPLGTVFALSTTGVVVSRWGWESVFYISGALGILWVFIWLASVHETPATHPHMRDSERQIISEAQESLETSQIVPWKRIFRAKAVWALVVNNFCSNWALYMLLAWLPSYFLSMHTLNLNQAGLASAGPWIVLFATTNLAAWLADFLVRRGVSLTSVRKFMQTFGLGGSAACLLLASGAESGVAAFLLLCSALGALGFTWSGFAPNHLDIAPRYAAVLVGVTNTAGTLAGLLAVSVTGWLVDLTGSYSPAFVLVAAINAFGIAIWLLFGTAEKTIH